MSAERLSLTTWSVTGDLGRRAASKIISACLIVCSAVLGAAPVGETGLLQAQIDAASAAGGGIVRVAPGEHTVAALALKSNVTLEIPEGAALIGSTNIADYAIRAVVTAEGVTNVAIVGAGTIDGRGRSYNRVVARFPHFKLRPGWGTVHFRRCRGVRIEGVTLRGSPGWTCHLKQCDGVDVRRMKIVAHDNFNNDGLDIESSNVRVEDCDIDSEDDALVFKTCTRDTFVTNVVVRNCRLSTNSSFIKFGTESKGTVRDVLVEDCDIDCRTPIYIRHDHRRTPGVRGVDNAIGGIEVLVVDGGTLEDVTIRNVRMGRGIIAPIFVRMGARRDPEPGRESCLRRVTIENVKMSEPSHSLAASSITGVPGRRPEDIVIRNVDLVYRGGCERDAVDAPREGEKAYPSPYNVFLSCLPAYGFYVRHADRVRLENVKLRVADVSEERPSVVVDDALVAKKGVDAFEPDAAALPTPGGYRLVDPGKTPFPMEKVREYVFPAKTFSIADFGAQPVPEPGTAEPVKCTAAFAQAIAAAAAAGGGRVLVPEGDWLTGAIHLKSNVELHLSPLATIIHTDEPSDYLPVVQTQWEGNECLNYSPLVYAFGCTNVAITGRGIFRPRLARWKSWQPRTPELLAATGVLYAWGCTNAPVAARDLTKVPGGKMRPHLIQFNRCANVLMRDFRVEDSPFWVIHTLLCDNVSVKRLNVFCSDGGNRDGMDIDMTRNVVVQGCEFRPGDDVFAMKAGRNADAWRLATPTENVVVRDCLAWSGHALLALGSELSGGLRNIWMHDMVLSSCSRVVYLKTSRRRGGFVKNVYLDRADVDHVRHFFRLRTDYFCQYNKFPDYEQRITEIDGVHLRDVKVRRVNTVFDIHGDPDLPAKDVTVEGLTIGSYKKLSDGPIEHVANAEAIGRAVK